MTDLKATVDTEYRMDNQVELTAGEQQNICGGDWEWAAILALATAGAILAAPEFLAGAVLIGGYELCVP